MSQSASLSTSRTVENFFHVYMKSSWRKKEASMGFVGIVGGARVVVGGGEADGGLLMRGAVGLERDAHV